MLALLGGGLIGVALLVLLALILAVRTARWRWLAGAEIAERLTSGLIACLALGMGCIELHRRVVPEDGPSAAEIVMLVAMLSGFVLLWWWFRLSARAGQESAGGSGPASERELRRR